MQKVTDRQQFICAMFLMAFFIFHFPVKSVCAQDDFLPAGSVTASDSLFEDHVEITWPESSVNSVLFRVLRIEGTDTTLLSLAGSNISLFEDFTGEPAVIYQYCVIAEDVTTGAELDIESDTGVRAISAPGSLTASDGEFEDEVRLTWRDFSEIEAGYNIYRKELNAADSSLIVTTAASTEIYSDTSAVAGVTYRYCVRAFDADGNESGSVCDEGLRGFILPPASVSATDGQDPNRVVITWEDQTDLEAGYIISRNDVVLDTTAANVESYIDSSAVLGITYTYCVVTLSDDGNESQPSCDDGGRGILPAPQNVAASDATFDDRIDIVWGDPSDTEDGFYIYRRDLTEADSVLIKTTAANAISFSDFDAIADIDYRYCVIAFSNDGGISEGVCDEGKQSLVVAPTNVAATDGEFEDRVEIAWESSSTTVVLFKLYRDGTPFKTISGDMLSCEDVDIASGIEHLYCVSALTALGDESGLACDSSGSRAINAPSNVQASDDEFEDRVLISWADNSSVESGFNIYRREISTMVSTLVGTRDANRTAFLDETGVPKTQYIYSVTAFDALGESTAASDSGSRVLLAPTNVVATDGEFEDQVEITWEDNSGVENGFRIYRQTTTDTFATAIGATVDNQFSFIDTSPDFGIDYSYSVVAFDSLGESDPVSDSGFTTILSALSFNASDVYEDRIELTWIDNSTIEEGYFVFRDGNFIDSTAADVTSYVDSNVTQGVTYTYCIQSFSGVAESEEVCDSGMSTAPDDDVVVEQLELSTKFTAGEAESFDVFGRTVAISGDYAVVGAPQSSASDGDTENNGTAHLFKRDADTGVWEELQQLNADDRTRIAFYGRSVAISGDYAIIGTSRVGAVDDKTFVFKRDPATDTWNQQQEISFDGPSTSTRVAIDDNTVLISDIGFSDSNIGEVYVWVRSGETWSQQDNLVPADGTTGDRFGISLSLNGDYAIIGASEDDDNGDASGSAYIFKRSGSSWTQQQKLVAPDGVSDDEFGRSVSIGSDYAIIGAYQDDDNGNESGSAYIFQRNGSTWTQQQKLVASDGDSLDNFGASVSISGDYAIIGAEEDDAVGEGSGSAYIFQLNSGGSEWVQRKKLIAADATSGDDFGAAVSIDDGLLIIGADSDDDNGNSSGSVYALEIALTPTSITASDGEFDNRIQVRWQDLSSNEDGFRIYRDGQLIDEVGANSRSYNDFGADPGRAYEYGVAAFNDDFGESSQEFDFGYRPADGNITGRIATRAGAGVEDVSVCLNPTPNNALLIDGSGGHVQIADDDSLDFSTSQDFTIEIWIKYTGTGGSGINPAIIEKWDGSDGYPFALRVNSSNDGMLDFARYDGSNNPTVTTNSSDLNDNEWHHVACVHDGAAKQLLIYVDGTLEGTTTYASLSNTGNGSNLYFGRRGNASDQWFGGQIDEVRIWSVVRDSADINDNMNQPLSGDEGDLKAYWPFDQGSGDIVIDLGDEAHFGMIEDGVYHTDNSAPLDVCATTDLEGNYTLANIRYGNGTTFEVTPTSDFREFQPAFKTITLDAESPVQNEVSFIDISSFTLSGFIKFDEVGDLDHSCFAEGVTILVDDVASGTTDKNGQFAVSAQIGEHTLAASFSNHTFEPVSITIDVTKDTAGIEIINTTTREISGFVGGGCGNSIGTATIEIRSEDDCLVAEFESDSNYEIKLPPQKYFVSFLDVDPPAALDKADILQFFDNIGTHEIDLTDADTTLDFIYSAPIVVQITGFEEIECSNLGVPIVEQGEQVSLKIEVFEDYGNGNLCPVDTGEVTIFDEIIDEQDTPTVLAIQNGQATYTTIANTPNIAAGRKDADGNDRSYQKALTAVVEIEGQDVVTEIAWVIVTGHSPRTATFTSVSEGIPLLILRDPPGDGSISFVEEGESFCSTISDAFYESLTLGAEVELKVGIQFDKGTPFFTTETKAQAIVSGGFEIGVEANQNDEIQICATTIERFSTSDNELFVGQDGDVYLGIAINLVFAKTDVIEIENCQVVASEAVTMGGDGFETTYLFTESHIANTVIPQLNDLAGLSNPDSAFFFESAAENWQSHLDLNDSLKTEAEFIRNRSFSAGADFDFSQTSDTTTTFTWDIKAFTNNERAVGLGFEESGNEGEFKFFAKLGFAYTRTESETETITRTVGYKLTDDDLGDFFTVDIKEDATYGTPIFNLVSGTSSCPWEPGTQPRDSLTLSITPPEANNIAEDDEAIFTLGLTNLSQSDESREYVLRAIQTSNPGGATFNVGGNSLTTGSGLSFFINPGQTQEATLSISRGPNKFNYENLALLLTAPCEYARWQNGAALTIVDTIFFDVNFEAPCSDITLFRPLSGWTFNQQDQFSEGDSLELILSDFTLKISETDSIQSVGVEYRAVDTDRWFPVPGSTTNKDLLEEGRSVTLDWDLSAIDDGEYELQAFTQCENGEGFSGIAIGTIDRQLPQVFGTPQPSDGVLSFGEDISITFNETIDCNSIEADNILLRNVDTDASIAINTVCDGRTIIIEPDASDDLENLQLIAEVSEIEDLNGNPMESAKSWIFDVKQTIFTWSQDSLTQNVSLRDPGSFTATLANGSSNTADFDLTTPDFLIADITSATLAPGTTQEIRFDIRDDVPEDTLTGVITADAGALGTVDLYITLIVTCNPPAWEVDAANFDHTMSITAEVIITGVASEDTADIVAAYVGDELRGVAPIEFVESRDEYLAFLTVYSNITTGERVRFQVWDDSECRQYNATEESFIFTLDRVIGTPDEPTSLNAVNEPSGIAQSINLNAGWTWFSLNLIASDMTINSVLSSFTPTVGDEIKSQTAFSQFDESIGWVGGLAELGNVASYMIDLENAGTLEIIGSAVDVATTPIPVDSGWNWIGYLPQESQTVESALANLSATEGDLIKSQFGFAQYSALSGRGEFGWVGSLQLLEPGQGYKMLLTQAGVDSFFYPASSALAKTSDKLVQKNKTSTNLPWSVNAKAYQYNMTMVVMAQINGATSQNHNDILGAFVGDECRGVAQPIQIPQTNQSLYFLIVYSNQLSDETLTFKVLDADAGKTYAADDVIIFTTDASHGTVQAPFELNADVVTAVDETEDGLPKTYSLSQNYPNPFNPNTTILFALPQPGDVKLKIFNTAGQLVRTLFNSNLPAGHHAEVWDGKNKNGIRVASGLYFYQLRVDGSRNTSEDVFIARRKMILTK